MTAARGEAPTVGTFREAVAEELRVHMTRKRVTGRELARRLHVSSQWISQRTRAVVPMDADDMEMIAGALDISVLELLADAARRASGGNSSSGNIGVNTVRYGRASSGSRPRLSLVTPPHGTYRDVGVGYGSCASAAPDTHADTHDPYLDSVNGERPSVTESAGSVNNAHAA